MKNECPGSRTRKELAWTPSGGYVGGLICPECALGMEAVHGSVRKSWYEAATGTWLPCYTGIVRVHRKES